MILNIISLSFKWLKIWEVNFNFCRYLIDCFNIWFYTQPKPVLTPLVAYCWEFKVGLLSLSTSSYFFYLEVVVPFFFFFLVGVLCSFRSFRVCLVEWILGMMKKKRERKWGGKTFWRVFHVWLEGGEGKWGCFLHRSTKKFSP